MIAKRTPNPNGIPGPNDSPFKSLATGVIPANDPYQAQSGIQDTFLAAHPADRANHPNDPENALRLFELFPDPTEPADPTKPYDHPYRKYELMNKIFNNITVRSNVFAVFVTVGFFEVTDESAVPPKLGAEIGKDEGRHVRYRMFAIVDRTQLAALKPFGKLSNAATAGTTTVQFVASTEPFPTAPTVASSSFTPQPGMGVQIGVIHDPTKGKFIENGIIQTVGANSITLVNGLLYDHSVDEPILLGPQIQSGVPPHSYMLAHPGPDPLNYQQYYQSPILFYSIIEGK
jgi:hypothetical protein